MTMYRLTVTLIFTVVFFLLASVTISVADNELNDIVVGGVNGPVIFTRPEGQRFFYFYVPSTYSPEQPLPLIIYLHGYGGNWSQGVEFNQTVDAEANGYIIAFGAGTPSEEGQHVLGWNGGRCCLFNTTILVDDVTYARMVVAQTSRLVAVAKNRIYVMGWSNGGYMAERIGCEAWDMFNGVAPDASAVIIGNGYEDGLSKCDAAFNGGHVDYIHFHGTLDMVVPWIGGHDTRERLPSVLENISRWVSRNGCDNVQTQTYNDGKNFTNIRWPNCRGQTSVELMTVWFAPHLWWTVDNSNFSTADYIMKSFTKSFLQRLEAVPLL